MNPSPNEAHSAEANGRGTSRGPDDRNSVATADNHTCYASDVLGLFRKQVHRDKTGDMQTECGNSDETTMATLIVQENSVPVTTKLGHRGSHVGQYRGLAIVNGCHQFSQINASNNFSDSNGEQGALRSISETDEAESKTSDVDLAKTDEAKPKISDLDAAKTNGDKQKTSDVDLAQTSEAKPKNSDVDAAKTDGAKPKTSYLDAAKPKKKSKRFGWFCCKSDEVVEDATSPNVAAASPLSHVSSTATLTQDIGRSPVESVIEEDAVLPKTHTPFPKSPKPKRWKRNPKAKKRLRWGRKTTTPSIMKVRSVPYNYNSLANRRHIRQQNRIIHDRLMYVNPKVDCQTTWRIPDRLSNKHNLGKAIDDTMSTRHLGPQMSVTRRQPSRGQMFLRNLQTPRSEVGAKSTPAILFTPSRNHGNLSPIDEKSDQADRVLYSRIKEHPSYTPAPGTNTPETESLPGTSENKSATKITSTPKDDHAWQSIDHKLLTCPSVSPAALPAPSNSPASGIPPHFFNPHILRHSLTEYMPSWQDDRLCKRRIKNTMAKVNTWQSASMLRSVKPVKLSKDPPQVTYQQSEHFKSLKVTIPNPAPTRCRQPHARNCPLPAASRRMTKWDRHVPRSKTPHVLTKEDFDNGVDEGEMCTCCRQSLHVEEQKGSRTMATVPWSRYGGHLRQTHSQE